MSQDDRIAALEAAQQAIEGRNEIDRLITRYARAVDEDIEEELAAVFAADAVLVIEPWVDAPVEGRANVVKSFKDYIGKFDNRKRYIVNRLIDRTGPDGATGWANWLVTQANGGQSYCGWGSYEFGFRRDAGIWRIARMVITVDSMTTLKAGWADMENRIAAYPD